jgi:predicted DNA-binding transcriptional regulator YafY
MPALSKQRGFEVLRATLALAEERGDGVALADAARAVDVDPDTLRELLAPVLFLAFHTSGELVDESTAFLLTEDDRLIVTEDHWLRSLASAPPDADAALRLLVAGLAMQSVAKAPTPDLDRAVAKLRDAVTDRFRVSVPTPPCLAVAQQARRDERSLRIRYLTDPGTTPSDREILPLRVFSRWGHWYVTGRELGTATEKQFRVDRMVSAEVGDVEFDAPPDPDIPEWFDLREHERTVRLRCRREQLDAVPRPVTIGPVTELADGRVEADVTISGDRRLDWMLVSLEPSTEVVSPPEAVARRRDQARVLLQRMEA